MKSQVMRAVRILRVIKVLRLVGTVRMAEDRGKRGALFAERTAFGFTILKRDDFCVIFSRFLVGLS